MVFLSPLSVSMALGMAANGARGETLDAMKTALGTSDFTRDEMNEAYRGLLDLLVSLDPKVDLGIANSAWAKEGFQIVPAFLDRVGTYFDAEARTVDFDDPGTKDVVNGWVREKTEGRIEEILGEIEKSDVLYLLNAIYFEGSWRSGFDPDETAPEPFDLEDGETVDVPLMSEEMEGLFYSGDDVRVADLPYGGEAFSMTLVVPTTGTLTELLESLTAERWRQWMAGLEKKGYLVGLPRFDLDFDAKLDEPLKRMGMGVAYGPDADFWDLAANPADTAVIDRVKHRTFLQVDEEGTEAAAVTLVAIGLWCDGCLGPATFTVDRPFLVAIRERLSGTLLFLGAVYDPS
jgi:serpin B